MPPIPIRSRLELFVDDFLVEKKSRVHRVLHSPQPREVALTFDEPWEGNISGYWTVFKDEDRFRMFYRGAHFDRQSRQYGQQYTCTAESSDGKKWEKPHLGVVRFGRSKKNNIVWDGAATHNFSPFKDGNPKCSPDARYKAVGGDGNGLLPFKSSDGIHWSLMREEPVITQGAFDSHNLAYWDTNLRRYVDFHRGFRNGVRDIMTCTSRDFVHWTDPVWLDYGKAPPEHLYTNSIVQYYRGPHLYLGFPKRFVPSRKVPDHPVGGVSDAVFMTSRDRVHWNRWTEAFIRPGLQRERWVNRNNMTAWGILETRADTPGLPAELSIYSSEGYYGEECCLRRFAWRIDGFVSLQADLKGGEILTRPLKFAGSQLLLNYSTSAAGSLRVEIQDEAGQPVPGFTLVESDEIYGDTLGGKATWKGAAGLSRLRGRAIRLRFVLKDADLYSMRFSKA